MRRAFTLVFLPMLAGCIQSVYSDGPDAPAPPGGEAWLLGEKAGKGRPILNGDRIEVDLVGRYQSGEIWAEGPFTLIVGEGTYPGHREPLRVGAVMRLQYRNDPNDTTVRLVPFPGLDTENEAFQVRRDRGPIIVEHTIRRVCRPLKVYFFQTGFGPIEFLIGCVPIPRAAPRGVGSRTAEIARLVAAVDAGLDAPPLDGIVSDPPAKPRAAADTSRYLGDDGLHLAVREARPEIVGWLLARGGSVTAVDSFGFRPIHYAGWAQRELERFVPAFEQSYLDVVDTLLAHGAAIDAPVETARPPASSMQAQNHVGQTTLGFAGPECADRLVRHLLERGARPDAVAEHGSPALTGAARNGCPETVKFLLASGANVDLDPQGGGTPLERLIAVSAFHQGHFDSARLLVLAGARREVAAQRLKDRLKDPGPGGFGFSNRPMARRILRLLEG